MKKEYKDYIFTCRKCGHLLFVDKLEVYKLIDKDCPECGEEGEIWIFTSEGNYDEN